MRATLLVAIGLGLLAGCASRPDPAWSPSPVQARLVELMGERLALAHQVAWYKFREDLPVRDRKRESATLRTLSARGKTMGLSSWETGRFFRAQMAASRTLQNDLIAAWRTGAPLPAMPPPDLVREIRPRMDDLNNQLLLQLAGAGYSSRGIDLANQAETYLLALDFPAHVVEQAVRPLR